MSSRALSIALVALAASLPGQDFRATITGQVLDQSGAGIAGAKVKAVQRSTNQSIERETNQDGYYTLPYLQPSAYDIEVTASGFHKMRRDNVTLLVAEKIDLPFKMEVGQMTTEVTVTSGSADLIQTADAS